MKNAVSCLLIAMLAVPLPAASQSATEGRAPGGTGIPVTPPAAPGPPPLAGPAPAEVMPKTSDKPAGATTAKAADANWRCQQKPAHDTSAC